MLKKRLGLLAIVVLTLFGLVLVGFVAYRNLVPADTPPPQADLLSVVVTEYHSVASPPTERVIFSQQFSDQAVISSVQKALLAIPLADPHRAYTCPTRFYPFYSYNLRFTEKGALTEDATVDETDCAFWTITTSRGKVIRLRASDDFWDQLRRIIGTPVPLTYYP